MIFCACSNTGHRGVVDSSLLGDWVLIKNSCYTEDIKLTNMSFQIDQNVIITETYNENCRLVYKTNVYSKITQGATILNTDKSIKPEIQGAQCPEDTQTVLAAQEYEYFLENNELVLNKNNNCTLTFTKE